MAQHMEDKAAVWASSLVHPPQCPHQTSQPLSPIPPTAQCPRCWEGTGEERQVQPLWGGRSEHSVMREDATPEGRGTAVPACKLGPARLEGAAAANPRPQAHPFLEKFGAEPATASAREQGRTNAMPCTMPSARLSRGEGLRDL